MAEQLSLWRHSPAVPRRTLALRIRMVSRVVATLAMVLMLGGLIVHLLGSGHRGLGTAVLPGPAVSAPAQILHGESPGPGITAMSLGLLALTALPALTVLLALWDYLRRRQWVDALVATAVLAILMTGAILAAH